MKFVLPGQVIGFVACSPSLQAFVCALDRCFSPFLAFSLRANGPSSTPCQKTVIYEFSNGVQKMFVRGNSLLARLDGLNVHCVESSISQREACVETLVVKEIENSAK